MFARTYFRLPSISTPLLPPVPNVHVWTRTKLALRTVYRHVRTVFNKSDVLNNRIHK